MRLRVLVIALLALLAGSPPAHARPTGIDSTVFGAAGCPLCHGGGMQPNVLLSGPTSVAPGSTNDYTFTIFANPAQNHGGLNVVAAIGTLATGGPFATGTQTVAGALGRAEITHLAPKQGDLLNTIEFSFRWTAPPAFSAVTLRAWGNAVNLDNTAGGDAADLAVLEIVSSVIDSPTPTATPQPSPTPCGDAAPLQPALLTDPDAALCQAAVAKAGAGYVKKDLKAVRSCLNAFQADPAGGDPIAQCVGSAGVGPGDGKATGVISKAQGKATARLRAKCSDADVAALDLCAETEVGLEECFLAQHRQHVIDLVSNQYGVVTPTDDNGEQKCQKAIGSAAAEYLVVHLRASQKCLVRRNKAGTATDGAAQCVGSLVGGAFVAPLDADVNAAIAGAAADLAEKISGKCDALQIAALGGCGSDPATAISCLLCTHRSTIFALISDEFGGLP
jgi:hypothetical protein